ncbi:MAG: cytochrome c oxidase accessory protein CcoG [Thiobacillus sp.]
MQTGLEEQLGPYQKRIPIVTRSIKGRFRNFKTWVLVFAYATFFLLPWLPWSRADAPSQAVLFDIPARRFLIFGLTAYPQDIVWFALLLFLAALLLFFVTGLIGRAFCGYFCFQTLWTDFFIWIERLLQGERPARVRLYRQPWGTEKLLKVGGTHALWIVFSFWTALTFVLYFAYAPEMVARFFQAQASLSAYLTVGILTVTTYAAAGWMREQICTYICPYGRFQSVMYAPQTLAVHYDAKRGENVHGRASARAGLRTLDERHAKGHGDCVDCGLCVQVCPAGIDIREGLQYKCISCGLCVDACSSIMDSFQFPRGLIRYDAEANLAKAQPAPPKLHWKRLNIIGYAVAFIVMSGLLAYSIAMRASFDSSVSQIRQPLYVVMSNGDIRNRYQIRLTNKTAQPMRYQIDAVGVPAGALDFGNFHQVPLAAGQSALVQASVRLNAEQAAKTRGFQFHIRPLAATAKVQVEPVHFDKPESSR